MNEKEAKAKTEQFLKENKLRDFCFDRIKEGIENCKYTVLVVFDKYLYGENTLEKIKEAEQSLLEKGYECSIVDNTTSTGCYSISISWRNA